MWTRATKQKDSEKAKRGKKSHYEEQVTFLEHHLSCLREMEEREEKKDKKGSKRSQ